MMPEAARAESGNTNNSTAAVKKRKVNRSQLSTDCLEILKKYKKAGICVPNKSDIPADLELALMENYELLSTRRKLRCLPREWKVIAENLSKEECIQYLKYHRWKEPVTNAPKGSGCRVSQCAIHSGCNHLLKMRWVIRIRPTEINVFTRLTTPLDPTKYSVEECGEHATELSNHVQGLHDFVLEDVDELLCAGMRFLILTAF